MKLHKIYISPNLDGYLALALFSNGYTIRMTGPAKCELLNQIQMKVNKYLTSNRKEAK